MPLDQLCNHHNVMSLSIIISCVCTVLHCIVTVLCSQLCNHHNVVSLSNIISSVCTVLHCIVAVPCSQLCNHHNVVSLGNIINSVCIALHCHCTMLCVTGSGRHRVCHQDAETGRQVREPCGPSLHFTGLPVTALGSCLRQLQGQWVTEACSVCVGEGGGGLFTACRYVPTRVPGGHTTSSSVYVCVCVY